MLLSLCRHSLKEYVICRDGQTYEPDPSWALPLLSALMVLQETLDALAGALPIPTETKHFEVDPEAFWIPRLLHGVKDLSRIFWAASAL